VRQENRFIDGSEERKSGTGKIAADHGVWMIRCVDFCHRAFAIAGNRAGGGGSSLPSKRQLR
jgi:hypothetical protein